MINCFNFFVESRHANLLFITMSKWFSQIFTQLDFLTSCARGGFPGCRVQFLFHTFPQVLRNLHNKMLKHIPLFCLRHSQATTPRFAQYNWVITLSSKIVPWWFLWNKTCKRLRKFWGWGIQEYLLRRSIIRNMHFLRKWGKIYISCNGAAVCKHHSKFIRANSISGRSEKYLIVTKLERQALISVFFFFFVFQASRNELHVPLTIKDRSLFIAREVG